MAQDKKSDLKFLVLKKGTVGSGLNPGTPDRYHRLNYSTLYDSLEPPLAIQDRDDQLGVKGLMYPGSTLDYDGDTGELNVIFPTALNFVDILNEDNKEPLVRNYQSGDFYLVTIGETETIELSADLWVGIDGVDYISVEDYQSGNKYRGNTGRYEAFGSDPDIQLINHTSLIASGLTIDVNISRGKMVINTIDIRNGGDNYVTDDIIEYKSTLSSAIGAYFKVVALNGAVTDLISILSPASPDIELNEEAGNGYLFPISFKSKLSGVLTRARTGNGTDLIVDAVTDGNGGLTNATIAAESQHNNYRNNDILAVFDALGQEGECLIKVKVDSENAGFIEAGNGDKVIYKGSTEAEEAKWIHVPVGKNDRSIIGIKEDPKGIAQDINSDIIYYNPEKAIETGKDESDKTGTIAIKLAYVKFEGSSTPVIDTLNSYAGFISPDEKYKLSTVSMYATPGDVNDITITESRDLYTPNFYRIIDIKLDETTYGNNFELSVRPAAMGMHGTVYSLKNKDVESCVAGNAPQISLQNTAVPSVNQVAEFFMPKNIAALRQLY